ncbi:MAG: hypothetical protein ABII74_08065 [Elusimicrobiota bacterium]
MKDLVVLVPDKNVKFAIDGLLSRFDSLNINKINYEIFIHPLRDSGVYCYASEFLRSFIKLYSYALVFLDLEGSGQEKELPDMVAEKIKREIEINGWKNRGDVIVFNPELEIWVWVESLHTARALGWDNYQELKEWLVKKNVWTINTPKPKGPKEAMEDALKIKRIPRSSSLYLEIAQKVSLNKCQDGSFAKFREILSRWFPKK